MKGYVKKAILKGLIIIGFGIVSIQFPGTIAAQDVELLVSPGKLSQVHAHLSGVNNCKKCHTEGKQTDVSKCLDCHKELAARIDIKKGFHRDKKEDCITCHPEHHGESFQLIELDTKTFDHLDTGYALEGYHKPITDCRRCHNETTTVPGKKFVSYLLVNRDCITCHKDEHLGQLGRDCQKCHSVTQRFKESKGSFNHNNTAFPLKGAHQQTPCEKCHLQKKWKGIPHNRCTDCHQDPHRPSFNRECNDCHNDTSWKSVTGFDHNTTRYPLRGKHKNVSCHQCHPKERTFRKVAFANCNDCHRQDPHQGQFKQDCRACHVESGFKQTTFNHQKSRYPLTGKHITVSCDKCHYARPNNPTVIYTPLGMACNDCHQDIHLGQLGSKCDSCHVTAGFKGEHLLFNHQKDSTYPLQGKHLTTACEKCHVKKFDSFPAGKGETIRYKPMATECITCHNDYHHGQLSSNCAQCHHVDSFKTNIFFDHQKTRFPLDEFHREVECTKCHPLIRVAGKGEIVETIKFKPIDTVCKECHRNFNHEATAFPLTGKHNQTDCENCHNAQTPHTQKTRKTRKGSFQCRDCHRSPHPGNQPVCTDCHTTQDWQVNSW